MRRFITLCESPAAFRIEDYGNHQTIVASVGGNDVAWFGIDTTYAAEGEASLHANVDGAARRQGIAQAAYDYAEAEFAKRGIKLVPSDRLSEEAYRLWLKRNPLAVEDYICVPRADGSENLYYSERAKKRWNLTL